MKEPRLPFPPAQYEEIRVQFNAAKYYPKQKGEHWVDSPGWRTVEDAQKVWPSGQFREKIPSIKIDPAVGVEIDWSKDFQSA